MQLISKYKWEIIISVFLALAYFTLRLIYLNRLPIFTDEAIYLRWAQIALHDASWRFISLTDGKQPMYVWVAMVFMKFIKDPLIAGRLVSVATGFFTMIGLWFLSFELFKNKRIAFLTSTLYVFYPFAQVLDRMALYDSMVGAFAVWAFYLSVVLVKREKLQDAYALGIIIGGGVLTKSSNFFSIYLLPFTALLFNFKKPFPKRFVRWIFLAGFASAIGYGMYNVLRLSPLYEMIAIKNATFVYPFSEWVQHPFVYLTSNVSGLSSWLIQYLTPSYILLILISLITLKNYFREKLLLITYFVLPFVALALFGNLLYPRFIFFMTLFLLPLTAVGLEEVIKFFETKIEFHSVRLVLPYILTLIFIIYPAFISFQFAYNPLNAKIADRDSNQYINGWAAGWGVKESVSFFEDQARSQKIYVATEGTFGLMPESMEMYLLSDKNITVKGYWPVDIFPKEVMAIAKKMPTYFIFYQPQHRTLPPDSPLKLVFKVQQGNTNDYYRVYQVTTK